QELTEQGAVAAQEQQAATGALLLDAQDELAVLRERHSELDRTGREREQEAERLQQELRALVQQLQKVQTDSAAELKQVREQRDLVAAMLVELSQVPQTTVEQIITAAATKDEARSQVELEELRQQFRELAERRPAEMVRHVLTHQELRKRCDIWDLYVTERGMIRFTAGDRVQEFRAESVDLFERRFYNVYKSLPQSKSLVIILFSYGDAKAVWREAVLSGLPRVTERMRADSSGRSRYEYAVLGYQPTVTVPRE
ncbi:MAG: hypothetical protein CMJ48_07520, partial [Planctomycetaceae bacterium]|nr:hypothetical protein [Planctomycetaceae bacterium]